MTFQIIFQTVIILMGFQLAQDETTPQPGLASLACGVLAIAQVVLQSLFIESLQKKVS